MRVIITGGTGLIGRALSQELHENGYEIVLLSRNPKKLGALPEGMQIVGWDAKTSAGWGQLADGADAIVNLAGESIAGDNFPSLILKRWTTDQKRVLLESRLNAGEAVLQAVQQAVDKPKVVIQASAVGYYGCREDVELNEFSPPTDDFLAEICKQWEATTAPVEKLGVRRAVIRTAGVALSLKSGAFPFMLLPFRLFVGGPLGAGKHWFSWIHIKDHVRAIRFLIENPEASGAFNLSSPEPLPNAQFSRILAKVLHRPYWLPVPAFALRFLFGEKANILLCSQRQIPARLLDLGFKFQYPTAESAVNNLFNA